MRDLAADKNVIEIIDGISGDVHEISYRIPSNQERVAYGSQLWKREGRRLKDQTYSTRTKFGKRIITGFKKGTLGIGGKPFSSDPKDIDYRADWLDLMCESAGDVVAAVAQSVFERTGQRIDPDIFVDSDAELDDDQPPPPANGYATDPLP
jgi:hypothetical protein